MTPHNPQKIEVNTINTTNKMIEITLLNSKISLKRIKFRVLLRYILLTSAAMLKDKIKYIEKRKMFSLVIIENIFFLNILDCIKLLTLDFGCEYNPYLKML